MTALGRSMTAWLHREVRDRRVSQETLVLAEPERLAALAHPLAWRIVQELAKRPDYVSRLAKRLRVHEQTVYYHANRLRAAGVLKAATAERVRGSQPSLLVPTAEAFAIALPGKGAPAAPPPPPEELRRFFLDFSNDGVLDAWIVLGAPTPHGPFLTAARDGPYAVQLGLALGSFLSPRPGMQLLLDTDARASGRVRENLIVVGGPVANIVTQDLNPHLPVRFDWEQSWRLRSPGGTSYSEEEIGLVAKIRNPADPGSWALVLAGVHTAGTVAAILAVTGHSRKVLAGYREGEFCAVVRGLDRDGDGRMDDVAVVEPFRATG